MVGFYKKQSGRGGMNYSQALDEALCFGWIDGVARTIDEDSYQQRFTPRKARSIWSAVNIKRVEALLAAGKMTPAGIQAYERRDPALMNRYANENQECQFSAAMLKQFKASREAWEQFQAQPPGYRKLATWYVLSAKRAETQARRLEQLIEVSSRGKRLPPLVSPAQREKYA